MKEVDQLLQAARVRWRVAFCVWFVVLTTATHWPSLAVGDPAFISPDKLIHFVTFGVLAFAFWCSGWVAVPWLAIRLMLGWAIIDEVTQAILPLDRPFSWADLTASMLGVLAAGSWMGALSNQATTNIRVRVTAMLATTSAWLVLCPIAVGTTLVVSAAAWSILWFGFEASQSSASLCVGLSVAVTVLIVVIIRWCKLQNTATRLAIKLLKPLTMIAAVSTIAWIVSGVGGLDQWTIAITIFTIGSSWAWRSAIGENTIARSM